MDRYSVVPNGFVKEIQTKDVNGYVKLERSELAGGSFTISNRGVSGSLLATPIILHQGQAAILGVGKLEKRVVVREVNGRDAMLIHPMAYVTLTIDHRVVDGKLGTQRGR